MQGPLDPCPVIRVEFTRSLVHIINLGVRYFRFSQVDLVVHKTGGGDAPQVKNDLEQVLRVVGSLHRMTDIERKHIEKGVKIVCYF